MSLLYTQAVSGATESSADYNANFLLTQNSVADLGPYVISGLAISAGTGLAVNVATGTASIGGRITVAATFAIAGLADSTTNHIYLKDDGTGTSNTTGTAPANSVKLGTALTAAGAVSSVAQTWASGRDVFRHPKDLVHGSGAGHPRAVDLASWHATNNEGNEVKGVLPSGSLPAMSLDSLSDVNLPTSSQGDILYRNATEWVRLVAGTSGWFLKTNGAAANPMWAAATIPALVIATKTANYTLLTTDGVILGDATAGNFTLTLPAVSGNSGLVYRIKKIDSSANTVTIDGNGSETIDGSLTAILDLQYAAVDIICDATTWWIF